mgnify:FL=1
MAKKENKLKGMKIGELEKEVISLREQLRAISFKAEGSKSKNVKEKLSLRKQVARALTMINQGVIK